MSHDGVHRARGTSNYPSPELSIRKGFLVFRVEKTGENLRLPSIIHIEHHSAFNQEYSSWWLNHPLKKICASQIGSFPQIGMKIKKMKPPPILHF